MSQTTDLNSVPTEVDVFVAGGGPSGLFLAADLAARGITAAVVEPRVELDWLHPRAKTTNARTMTHLRRLGLAAELRRAAPLSADYSDCVMFATSLVGHELTRFANAFQLQAGRYELQPECGQQVAQPVVEQVLRHAVQRSDLAHLVLGASFVESVDVGDAVEVTIADANEAKRTVRARYLVGADGVASTVRKGLGVRLEGSSAAKSNLGVLFRSAELADRVRLDPAVQYWVVGETYAGMVGAMDLTGLWWAIIQGYQPAAPQFAGVPSRDIVRSMIGADVDIEVLAEDPWTARMLLSPTYRVGNTFLVGDAAHANPPWGGHGFNTCIGDAANLAWKLAAAIDGWAGPALLDSYQSERRPVARRTIEEAEANGTVLADDVMDPALDLDGPEGEQARSRAAELLQVKESEFHSLGLVLGYDYADSPLVSPDRVPAPPRDPITYRPSAVAGCLLPHVWLDEQTSIYDVLGSGFTVLVDADAEVDLAALLSVIDSAVIDSAVIDSAVIDSAVIDSAVIDSGAADVPVVVRTVRAPDRSLAERWQAPMVLVRPDQHVAWRGSRAAELSVALRRAAGEPASRSAAAAAVAVGQGVR